MAGENELRDLDRAMERIRSRVDARRAAGEYPADLEERLGAHFERIRLLRAEEDRLEPVRVALEELERRTQFALAHNTSSKNPVGERYHRLMDEAISRQVEPLVGQVRAYVDQLRVVFKALIDRLEDPGSHIHADLLGQIDAALDRLGQLHAMPADPAPRVTIEDPRPVPNAMGTAPWVSTAQVVSFRHGTIAETEQRFAGLISQLTGLAGPALGIDAGRGEILDLLAGQGLVVQGWERQDELAAQASGAVVQVGDGLGALAAANDGSVGLVVLPDPSDQQRLADTVALAALKLRPEGRLLVTGVDPDGVGPMARRLRADPRHPQWIYPETVELLCLHARMPQLDRWGSDGEAWELVEGSDDRSAPLFAVMAGR